MTLIDYFHFDISFFFFFAPFCVFSTCWFIFVDLVRLYIDIKVCTFALSMHPWDIEQKK